MVHQLKGLRAYLDSTRKPRRVIYASRLTVKYLLSRIYRAYIAWSYVPWAWRTANAVFQNPDTLTMPKPNLSF